VCVCVCVCVCAEHQGEHCIGSSIIMYLFLRSCDDWGEV
jgi:hypothetical protein